MLLQNLIPEIPNTINEILIYIVAILGIILLIYAVFLETEKRQDLVIMIGTACLFVYAVFISSLIFMIAMGGLFIAALVEFIEILLGIHKPGKYELKQMVRGKRE